MQARLKVLHDKANVKQVKLLPVTLIGRSTDCNLKIASSQVSRNHCRITLGEDTVFIEDLGSANGTLVDGQPLVPHQPMAVAPGARLLIGSAEFLIDYVAPASMTMVLSRSEARPTVDTTPTESMLPAGLASVIPNTLTNSPVAPPAPVVESPVAVVSAGTTPIKPSASPVVVSANLPVTGSMPGTAIEVPPESPEPSFDLGASAEPIVDSAEAPEFEFSAGTSDSQDDGTDTAEVTMFPFIDPSAESKEVAAAASTVAPKKGGLKSLFSLFGRKDRIDDKKQESQTTSEPTPLAAPSVFLPTLDAQVAHTPPESADEFVPVTPQVETGHGEETNSTEPADDGFAQFLQQL